MGEQREPDRAREALHNTGSEWSHRERKEDREREGEVGRIERREGMDREKEKKADEEKKRREREQVNTSPSQPQSRIPPAPGSDLVNQPDMMDEYEMWKSTFPCQ